MSNQLIDKALAYLGEKEVGRAQTYTANWTATSSSASGTYVTESLSLSSGIYVIVVTSPTASANFSIGLAGAYKQMLAAGDCFVQIISLSATTTVRANVAQSASVTFSNTSRGSLSAVKIS